MNIDIDKLTIGQVKELTSMFGVSNQSLNNMIGKKVIIRTYSAGVWFGLLEQKAGNEVIITSARRLWSWHSAKSISLSGVAVYGIIQEKSKITPAVESVWLEAIEIIPCTDVAIESFEGAEDVEAQ